MYIELLLIKPLVEGDNYFDGVPNYLTGYDDLNGKVERYDIDEKYEFILGNDFLDYINSYCDSLVGPGDVDFLSKDQCAKLCKWIVTNKNITELPDRCDIYKCLLAMSKKAVELETGLIIEL